MKIAFTFILQLLLSGLLAQDTSHVHAPGWNNFGIFAGPNFSQLDITTHPNLLDADSNSFSIYVRNKVGLIGGLFYQRPLNRGYLRWSVAGNFTVGRLVYDYGKIIKPYYLVQPFTVQAAMHYRWGKKRIWQLFSEPFVAEVKDNLIAPLAGLAYERAIEFFNSAHPGMKLWNAYAEVGIGLNLNVNKMILRMDAVYSFGLVNLTDGTDDYYTNAYGKLRKNFFSLRFYFQ